jgi:hypothetical protein
MRALCNTLYLWNSKQLNYPIISYLNSQFLSVYRLRGTWPWKAVAVQYVSEVPAFYGSHTFQYCCHNSTPLVPILSHINPLKTKHFCFI